VTAVRRYLLVANQTLGGEHLVRHVRRLLAQGPCSFHVLVPATPPRDMAMWTEGEAHAVAGERLRAALERLRALGAEADGEVGDARPIEAINDVLLRGEAFDGIILSTLPPGLSRWLRLDLPHRVEAQFGLPVAHLVGRPEGVPGRRATGP
jgi:GABA permease